VNGILIVKTSSLEPGTNYNLYSAPSAIDPFHKLHRFSVPNYEIATIELAGMDAPFYKLESTGGIAPPSQKKN